MSEWLIAVILGFVEGLTEYLPVSSTGHLIIAGDLLSFSGERAKAFEIFIQSGAILAVVVLYPRFFINLLNFKKEPEQSASFSGLSGLSKLAAGALPAFVMGFLLHSYIKTYLFSSFTVAIGLLLGSLLILWIERKEQIVSRQKVSELTIKDCFLIGVFQCLALWPGVSRSGATIVGGLLLGCSRSLAAEFSFLLAVPVLMVATAYDLLKSLKFLSTSDIPVFAIGFVVSFVVALVTVKYFIKYVQHHNFSIFAYYRVVLALFVLAFFKF